MEVERKLLAISGNKEINMTQHEKNSKCNSDELNIPNGKTERHTDIKVT